MLCPLLVAGGVGKTESLEACNVQDVVGIPTDSHAIFNPYAMPSIAVIYGFRPIKELAFMCRVSTIFDICSKHVAAVAPFA